MSEDESDDRTGGPPHGDAIERRSGRERRAEDGRRTGRERRSGEDRRGSGLKSPPAASGVARPYGFRSFDERRTGEDRRSGRDRRAPADRRYAEPEITLSAEELEALLGPAED